MYEANLDQNQHYKEKLSNYDKYRLFDEHLERLDCLDIDRYKLPIFEEFVKYFLINTGEEEWNLITMTFHNINKFKNCYWYQLFIQAWSKVSFRTLMIMMFGYKAYMDEYKIRLNCQELKAYIQPYSEFVKWCGCNINILHRYDHYRIYCCIEC